jgi:hypothetical protein
MLMHFPKPRVRRKPTKAKIVRQYRITLAQKLVDELDPMADAIRAVMRADAITHPGKLQCQKKKSS